MVELGLWNFWKLIVEGWAFFCIYRAPVHKVAIIVLMGLECLAQQISGSVDVWAWLPGFKSELAEFSPSCAFAICTLDVLIAFQLCLCTLIMACLSNGEFLNNVFVKAESLRSLETTLRVCAETFVYEALLLWLNSWTQKFCTDVTAVPSNFTGKARIHLY